MNNVVPLNIDLKSNHNTGNTQSINKIIVWDLNKAADTPHQELFDLMNDNQFKNFYDRRTRDVQPINKTQKDRYLKKGIHSLSMKYVKRAIIDFDEILIEDSFQDVRVVSVERIKQTKLKDSFISHGWRYNEQLICLYILPQSRLKEIQSKNPNSNIKYGIITGNGRSSSLIELGMTDVMADIYEYNNSQALHIWKCILNPNLPAMPSINMLEQDVEKNWKKVLEDGIYEDNESSFDTFMSVYGFKAGFDNRTIAKLKNKLVNKKFLNGSNANESILNICSDPRSVKSDNPRSLEYIANDLKIPSPTSEDNCSYMTYDGRVDGLFRDKLEKVITNPNNIIPVFFYTDAKKASSQGLKVARQKIKERFNKHMSHVADVVHVMIKNLPENYDNLEEDAQKNLIMKSIPWKFRGFLPQLMNNKGDMIEKTLVDENGNSIKYQRCDL